MKTVIEMAREAGAIRIHERPKEFAVVGNKMIERFAELIRAEAIRENSAEYRMGWNDGQIAEREACAKVCDDLPTPERMSLDNESLYECATLDCADAIRARSNT